MQIIFLISLLGSASAAGASGVGSAGLSYYNAGSNNGPPIVGANLKSAAGQASPTQKCDRITVALCQDTPYNYTRMPNVLGHYDQHMVAMALEEYKPLIEVACSEHLKFFLCSIFTPMCTENVDAAITSCRSVCEEVKRNCLPLLKNFGFNWPDALNCSQFPPKGTGALCMDPSPESGSSYSKNDDKQRPGHPSKTYGQGVPGDRCPPEFIDLVHSDPSKPCALRCDRSWMFKTEHKQFAEWWMAAWSMACIVVTAFTIVTFCLDTSRFRYPERSIVFLSICYNLYAWAYVLRLIFGAEESSCQQLKNDRRFLIVGGLDNPKCVIVFMILYYFGTASAIWWVVLTFTWFLAAAHKWGQEAIAGVSSYFHLAAWGVPALLTIAVLITHQVDASELTGLCFVGQHNSRALLGFVIAPMTLFLIVGSGFIVAGFAAMIRIRQEIRNRARDTTDLNKLEKLMVKIGIFSMLYVLPALTVIGCSFYEKSVLDDWSHSSYAAFCSDRLDDFTEPRTIVDDNNRTPHRTMLTDVEQRFLTAVQQKQENSDAVDETPLTCLNAWQLNHARPKVDVYIIKIFMTLIVGITSGMWVWSRKTCATWQRRAPCCSRFCLCCRLFDGPTGAKTLVQYPAPPSSSTAAVGVPLLAGQLQSGQPYLGVQQQQQPQRNSNPTTHTNTSSSYHHRQHPNRHPNSSCANTLPMQTFANGPGYGVPSQAYTTTASSEASAKM